MSHEYPQEMEKRYPPALGEAALPLAPHASSAKRPPLPEALASHALSDLVFTLTVSQLGKEIRARGIDSESAVMLSMLESLVIAGEITLGNFMQRIEHLFPEVFASMPASLMATLQAYATE